MSSVSTKCFPASCAEMCLCVQLYYSLFIYTSTLCRILISWFINKIRQNSALWVFVMEHITGVQPSILTTAIIIATGLCLYCVKKICWSNVCSSLNTPFSREISNHRSFWWISFDHVFLFPPLPECLTKGSKKRVQ